MPNSEVWAKAGAAVMIAIPRRSAAFFIVVNSNRVWIECRRVRERAVRSWTRGAPNRSAVVVRCLPEGAFATRAQRSGVRRMLVVDAENQRAEMPFLRDAVERRHRRRPLLRLP